MAKRITSKTEAYGKRGVFILFQGGRSTPKAIDQSRCVLIGQFPWGPENEIVEYGNAATFRRTFAPDGFSRIFQNYLLGVKFPWTQLALVRVIASDAVKASKTLASSTPTNVYTLTAKYYGAAGNSIAVVVAAATNAVANSFNLTVSMTDTETGKVTTETYENIDSTQTDADYFTSIIADSLLLGGFVRLASGRPVNGSTTLASGSDGTIASADYLGTPGDADAGLALLEADNEVDFFAFDDMGSGLRSAVNAGGKAHCTLMADPRVFMACGEPAETLATATTNAGTLDHDHVVYTWGHCYVLDEEGTERLTTLSGACACFMSKLQPQVSGGIKNRDLTRCLEAIQRVDVGSTVESNREDAEAANVCCFERNKNGVFSPYSVPCTDGTPLYVTRMRDYIGFSLSAALEDFRGSPNADIILEEEFEMVDTFMRKLVENGRRDVITNACVKAYEMVPLDDSNTEDEIQAGDATITVRVTIFAEQKRFFLIVNAGTNVTVDVEEAA